MVTGAIASAPWNGGCWGGQGVVRDRLGWPWGVSTLGDGVEGKGRAGWLLGRWEGWVYPRGRAGGIPEMGALTQFGRAGSVGGRGVLGRLGTPRGATLLLGLCGSPGMQCQGKRVTWGGQRAGRGWGLRCHQSPVRVGYRMRVGQL